MSGPVRFRKELTKALACLSLASIAGVLGYSGISHFYSPGRFAISVTRYELLPEVLAYWTVVLLPSLQITTAAALLTRQLRLAAIASASVMLTLFAMAQVSVLVRGLDIDCGCFGSLSTTVSWRSVLIVSALAVASWVSLFSWWRGWGDGVLSTSSGFRQPSASETA